MEEGYEHDVEPFEAGENAPESCELAKQSIDFVAPLVELLVIFPRLLAIVLRRHDGRETHFFGASARFIALVSLVDGQGQVGWQGFGLLLSSQSSRSVRPSTPSLAWPGDRLNVTAV